MKHSDFKAGQKYLCGTGKLPVLCVGHNSRGEMVYEDDNGHLYKVLMPELWREYVEPVVRWCYLAGAKGFNIVPFLSKEEAERFAGARRVFKMIEVSE